jgi:hypothetical protein
LNIHILTFLDISFLRSFEYALDVLVGLGLIIPNSNTLYEKYELELLVNLSYDELSKKHAEIGFNVSALK